MSQPHIPVARPYLGPEEVAAVVQVLESRWWTGGAAVSALESTLTEVTGAAHAVTLSSGTTALSALLEGLGVRSADSLLVTSSLNFAAVAASAKRLGAAVGLTDVDASTLNMSPASLDALLDQVSGRFRRVLVVPVHYAGRAADMGAITDVTRGHGAWLAEDASHVLGTAYSTSGPPVGSWPHSKGATFSFHPNKPVAGGEGGAVVTDDGELAGRLRALRNHNMVRHPDALPADARASEALDEGDPWYYEIHEAGMNFRLSDLHAAVALAQLQRVRATLDMRTAVASNYDTCLADMPWCAPLPVAAPGTNSQHLYPVLIDLEGLGTSRRAVFDAARAAGISLQVHYVPLHKQPFLSDAETVVGGGFPVLDSLSGRLVSLPLYPDMTQEEQERVCSFLGALPSDTR